LRRRCLEEVSEFGCDICLLLFLNVCQQMWDPCKVQFRKAKLGFSESAWLSRNESPIWMRWFFMRYMVHTWSPLWHVSCFHDWSTDTTLGQNQVWFLRLWSHRPIFVPFADPRCFLYLEQYLEQDLVIVSSFESKQMNHRIKLRIRKIHLF
jgi:hypothetical protein